MSESSALPRVTDDILSDLALPGLFPVVLVLPDSAVFINDTSRELFCTSRLGEEYVGKALAALFHLHGLSSAGGGQGGERGTIIRGELELDIPGIKGVWVEIRGREVAFSGKVGFLTQFVDVTAKHTIARERLRLSVLREIMLDVTQQIIRVDTLEEMCQLVLQNAVKAIPKASLGSIMLRGEGNTMRVASYIGYDHSVKDFSLPLARTFHYRASRGDLAKVVNIADLNTIGTYNLIPTAHGEGIYIKSVLSAPIQVNGELFGIISIDSVETDSFDSDDEKSMAFLRDNIEIAVANHLLYQEKSFLASFDRLTGLHNRTFFEEHFGAILARASRYRESFCLALFDVDDLKQVNDTFGHLAGDEVLRRCASGLKYAVRKSDIVARYGGDEFVGIFFETDPESLAQRLQRVLSDIADSHLAGLDDRIRCTVSYGIAQYPDNGLSIEELIRHADEGMYKQKCV